MSKSILDNTKKLLGIEASYDHFDMDILLHINTAIATLNQVGVGPAEGFQVEDNSSNWEDLLGTDLRFAMAKTYIYDKVRLSFDPPGTSFAISAIQERIKESEWRLSVLVDELQAKAEVEDAIIWVIRDQEGFPTDADSGELGIDPVSGNVWRKL